MKKIIEKFYRVLFQDKADGEGEVPFANKAFIFYFSLVVTLVVLILFIRDIVRNIQSLDQVG